MSWQVNRELIRIMLMNKCVLSRIRLRVCTHAFVHVCDVCAYASSIATTHQHCQAVQSSVFAGHDIESHYNRGGLQSIHPYL